MDAATFPCKRHAGRGDLADGLRRKLLEAGFGQQHDVNGFADDHASGGLVCVMLVEAVAQMREELDRLLQILHRQVHKNIGCHVVSPRLKEWSRHRIPICQCFDDRGTIAVTFFEKVAPVP